MHFIILLRLSCAVCCTCLHMNSGFSIKCSRFLGERHITLTFSTIGMGKGSISGAAIKITMPNFPQNTFVPAAHLADRFQHPTIQSSYNPASAVCQLNLPHLQHHQSLLMLKIIVRPVKAQLCKNWHAG